VASPDGGRLIRDEISGGLDEAGKLGISLAERLLEGGGREILETIY
jgi:hydroxymethylbilane synthase